MHFSTAVSDRLPKGKTDIGRTGERDRFKGFIGCHFVTDDRTISRNHVEDTFRYSGFFKQFHEFYCNLCSFIRRLINDRIAGDQCRRDFEDADTEREVEWCYDTDGPERFFQSVCESIRVV